MNLDVTQWGQFRIGDLFPILQNGKANQGILSDGNDCFYVGNDLYDDVLGAHNSGLKTVYIETEQSGKYPSEDLVAPDYTASTHQKLMELLFDLAEGKKE